MFSLSRNVLKLDVGLHRSKLFKSKSILNYTSAYSYRFMNRKAPRVTSTSLTGNLVAVVKLQPTGFQEWLSNIFYLESFESLLTCTSVCRQAAWKVGYLDMTRGLRTQGSTVIVGQRFGFPDMPSLPGSFPLSQLDPRCLIKLTHRGKSSFELRSTFHSNESSCPVVEHMVKFVYLPKHGGATFPDWFRESYDTGINSKPGPHFEELQPSNICRELLSKTFAILPEHIDLFGHTNNEVYIRFTMEAFNELVRSHGSNLSWIHLPLSKVEIYFSNETLLGETVQVKIVECVSEGVTFIGALIVKETDSSTALHFKVIFKNNIVKNALKL